MKSLKSNGGDKPPKKTWIDSLACNKTTPWLEKQFIILKALPSAMWSFSRETSTIVMLVIGFVLGVFWNGNDYEKAEALTEQASVIYVEANDLKVKANKQSYVTANLEKKVADKDKEIEYLKSQTVDVVNLVELTRKQDEAIALRDETIVSLKVENKQLRASLQKMEDAYLVQTNATEAYKEAITQEKLISFGWGSALGAALAFVILK